VAAAYTFLGTGPRFGLAGEAMLKVKEMSLVHAESFQSLEFRHGPISTVSADSVVVGLLPDAPAPLETAVLDDVARVGGATVALGPAAGGLPGEGHRRVSFDAGIPPPWRDVLYLPVVHQTAVALAGARGLDPDRPTNLEAVVILDE
jgi:glutamine---fructose-6-phosphate transaminase (isomerizing)